MSRAKAPQTYTYRWTGDYAAVIDGHSTPEGNGVLATPGENFTTVAPLEHVNADPQGDTAETREWVLNPQEEEAEQAPESTDVEEPSGEEDSV